MLSELIVKVGADVDGFNKEMSKLEKRLKELSDQFKSIGENMQTYFSLPLGIAGFAMIKFSSDFEESLNKVKIAFGDSARSVIAWSETSIRQMGLASGSALDAAALFGDMATSMGISRDRAAEMSMQLVKLGADMASFKNVPIEQAMSALSGVFTGETESLKMLGIIMLETNLQAFALSQGINKKIEKMTEAEKVALRYAYILDKTKNSQGDFARTSEGAANQMRMFGENLKQLAVVYGQELLPVFTSVLIELNKFLVMLGELPKPAKQLILIIGGLTAVVGPMLIALGAIAAIAPTILGGLASIATSFALVVSGAIAIPPAIFAAGLAIVGIGAWSFAIYSFQKDFDRFSAGFVRGLEYIKNNAIIIINKIKNAWDEFRIWFQKFKMVDDQSREMVDELHRLEAVVTLNKRLREQESQVAKTALAVSDYRYQLKLLKADLDDIIEKQNENAGMTDYMTSWEIIRNEQTAKSLELNKRLIESKNKQIELDKKLADEQKESVTKLGNAIERALNEHYQKKIKMKLEEVAKFEKIDIDATKNQMKRANEVFDNEIKKAKETSQSKIDNYKNEQKEKLKLIDKEFANEIQFLEDVIKAEENKTKIENQQMADAERLAEISRKQELIKNADSAKLEKINAQKSAAALLELQIKADRDSEKQEEEAQRQRELLEAQANAKLAKERMTHDFNQKLQAANNQEARRKVVADFEYERVQDEIDLSNRLAKINSDSDLKLIEIDKKYADKISDNQLKLNDEISKIDANITSEKERTQEELTKEQAQYDRTLLLRQRENNVEVARLAIEAAQKRVQIKRDEIAEEERVKLDSFQQEITTEIERINDLRDEVIKGYDKKLEDLDAFHSEKRKKYEQSFTELLKQENIQEEVRRLVAGKNQESILEVLKSYNSNWMEQGRTYGQQLIDGLLEKKQSMEKAVKEILNLVPKSPQAYTPQISYAPASAISTYDYKQISSYNFETPINVNVNMDGYNVASRIAPYMTDTIRAKTGAKA